MDTIRFYKIDIISQYLMAVITVLILTIILQFFSKFLSIQVIALLFLLPVVLCSRLWGFGPGILAAFTTFACFNYFFIPPLYSFYVHSAQDLLSLFVFLVIVIVVSQLLGRAQDSVEEATNREQEATRLYELSTALSGHQDKKSILQLLTEKISETFQTEGVTVESNERLGRESFSIPAAGFNRKPDITLSMMTVRGEQGKISIWRNSPLSPPEQRILRTFANQSALAIERAVLMEVENRAKVLEESDVLKTAILSSVSHELRTPLATIKASISSIRSDSLDLDEESRQELLSAIEEETDHLNNLVGNLLDMSRIEIGALQPQRKWNSLSEIINGVLKRMRQFSNQHQITLDIPENLPLIWVDYIQMDQVFTNLLSNSVKYAPPLTEVKIIAAIQPDQTLLVKVTNQGPHVAEEHLERIFDKFYRVTAAEKISGTGLGLSICKGIINAHGGKIWAENIPEGLVFIISLPINQEGNSPHMPKEI